MKLFYTLFILILAVHLSEALIRELFWPLTVSLVTISRTNGALVGRSGGSIGLLLEKGQATSVKRLSWMLMLLFMFPFALFVSSNLLSMCVFVVGRCKTQSLIETVCEC